VIVADRDDEKPPPLRDFVVVASAREERTNDENPIADSLALEFPTVRFSVCGRVDRTEATMLELGDWLDASADLLAIDERIEAECRGALGLVAADEWWSAAAMQLLTRYQWRLDRRNDGSATPLFDRVLERHRALHDLGRPLVRADYVHTLDTWQWMLRLDAGASACAQMAALLHDLERLITEPEVRVEHRAPDYTEFKRAHAREGARMVRAFLEALDVPTDVAHRVEHLVEAHEEPREDDDLALLNDADGLSFFSRNSDGFVRYYGEEHTRTKVRFTLSRLSAHARARLSTMRLSPEIRRHLDGGPGPTAASKRSTE
jgi:hypothetical protein